MFALSKRILLVLTLTALCGVRSASAFSLLGPLGLEPYQVATIGYGINGDVGDPRNIAEEYRWNTPVVYYAFDQNFLDFFGSNGVAAVEQAISILNGLQPVSSYSPDLSEFPLNVRRINYTAQALNMFDLKSATMNFLLEELGLAQAERWVWTLRARFGTPCPVGITYAVVQRNYDPNLLASGQYSSYVNDILYDYVITELCAVPAPPTAWTDNFPVDPQNTPTTVANILTYAFEHGVFFSDLTRDDVGGLRYMLHPTNINWEAVSPDSLFIDTNNSLQLITTTNFASLASASLTNPPAQLLALFPGLVINSFTEFPTNIVTTNIVATFTNVYGTPPGASARLVLTTNLVTNSLIAFNYVFGNVITNITYTKGYVSSISTTVGVPNNAPPGSSPTTNTTTSTVLQNFINGEYFLIPTNACGFSILSTQLTSVVIITNLTTLTNTTIGATNINGQSFTMVTYLTNHTLLVSVPNCVAGTVALRHGIDKISFVRANYDSLIGKFFNPITNIYSLTAHTNFQDVTQTFQRTVVVPDFLFSAEDRINAIAAGQPEFAVGYRSVPHFNSANIPAQNPGGIAGPGTIASPVVVQFNKVGPLLVNVFNVLNPFFFGLSQQDGLTNFVWGSYDGTTNYPVLYPNGSSIANIEAQMYLGMANVSFPDGNVNAFYSAQLQGLGSAPPFTWSLSPLSPGGFPPGLNISANSSTTAVISGAPTSPGIYDFTVRLSDSAGRSVDQNLVITIH